MTVNVTVEWIDFQDRVLEDLGSNVDTQAVISSLLYFQIYYSPTVLTADDMWCELLAASLNKVYIREVDEILKVESKKF